jgi:DNA polymerase-3 subunit gamma/tau
MYVPLSLKYRPKKFSEVFGQDVTKTIFINSILFDREIKSMFLTGAKGTGKTTLARIYGKALNCKNFKENEDLCMKCPSCLEENHPDIVELDSASNNGVDFVRDELGSFVFQAPFYKRKVIILDEVHMMSVQAQASFLKLLEEPPKNVTFILVTTNPEKITDTIRSRCLSMPLVPLSNNNIEDNIKFILEKEKVEYCEDIFSNICLYSKGSLRDAQQMLDRLLLFKDGNKISFSNVENILDIISVNQYMRLAGALCSKDFNKMIKVLDKWYEKGVDLDLLFFEGVPNLIRDFSIFLSGAYCESTFMYTGISLSLMEKKQNENLMLTFEEVNAILKIWEEYYDIVKSSGNVKIGWYLFFMRVSELLVGK